MSVWSLHVWGTALLLSASYGSIGFSDMDGGWYPVLQRALELSRQLLAAKVQDRKFTSTNVNTDSNLAYSRELRLF